MPVRAFRIEAAVKHQLPQVQHASGTLLCCLPPDHAQLICGLISQPMHTTLHQERLLADQR